MSDDLRWEPQNWSYECLFGFLLLLFHCPRVFIRQNQDMDACDFQRPSAVMLFVLYHWLWLWKILKSISLLPHCGIIYDFYCTKKFVSFLHGNTYVVLTHESCSNSLAVQRRMDLPRSVFGGLEGNIWQTRLTFRTKLWLYDPYLVPVLIC